MIQNGRRISWVYTVLLFHAAVPDRTLSSEVVTGARATEQVVLESRAVPASWFQHWTIHSGRIVPGEFATVPGAFKYSAIIEVERVRCSAAVIASRWVLSSTHCFSRRTGATSSSMSSYKTARDRKGRIIVQADMSGEKLVGFVYAGGIKYKVDADKEAEGVQQQRLERLLLYTETQTDDDLRAHDIMLAQVGPLGFRFNNFVQPIRFTDQRRFSLIKPRTCIVVGFGDDNYETITLASLQEKCSEKVAADNSVCVDEFRWPCIGDAGAPLVCQNMLVGTLRSEGLLPNHRCVKHAKHTAKNFTFVGYYRDWIVEHAAVKFGVWRSGAAGRRAFMSGERAVSYAALLLLHAWMYMCLQ